MLCVDVNVLAHAHRKESPRHDDYRRWLKSARIANEPLGIGDVALSSFHRIVTDPRIFIDPTPLAEALGFAQIVRSSPSAVTLSPGPRHWSIFANLCERGEARGNLIPDAFFAALAIESDSTWITADRGFARFPGLKVANPLDGP
jgi:uncharacterized protein